MELSRKIGNITMEGFSALNAAECFLIMKEVNSAWEYLSIAKRTLKSTNDKIGQAHAWRVHGLIFLAEKQYGAAEKALNKSIAIAKVNEMGSVEAEALRTLTDVFLARGEKDAAKKALRRVIELYDLTKKTRESEEARKFLENLERS